MGILAPNDKAQWNGIEKASLVTTIEAIHKCF
jgi:hypothetical protein